MIFKILKYALTVFVVLLSIRLAGFGIVAPDENYPRAAILSSPEEHWNWLFSNIKPFYKFVYAMTPALIRDSWKLFLRVPGYKLTNPANLKHASIEETRYFLKDAFLSYCPQYSMLNKECLNRENYADSYVIEDESIDSLVMVAANLKMKKIIVSYRPTLTPQNWQHNFDYQQIDVPSTPFGVRVHHGFYSYYLSSYHETHRTVSKLLEKPEYNDFSLFVTGYSLGAATATVSVPGWYNFLKENNYPHKMEVITYSGPRAGNANFAEYLKTLNITLTRYTNKNDIVSHLPPRSLGYVHAGVEIHQHKKTDDELVVCRQEFDEDPECALGDRHLLFSLAHLLPFGKYVPLPPYS